MLQKPTFRSTWLPMGLAALALVVLNVGLYARLSAQPTELPSLSLPYSADYATDQLGAYSSFGGDWEIKDQTLVQLSTGGFDLGTNIPLNIPAEQPYFFEAQMRMVGGTNGGGLLFNAQQPGIRQQSHMARFNVDANQLWLIYGYFGSDSNFVGQGSAPLTLLPGNTDPHMVRVEVTSATYTLLLDGQIVAADVPLEYHGGAVGLITSAAQVAFDDVRANVLSAPVEATQAVQNAASAPAADATLAQPEPMAALFDETFQGGASAASDWTPFSGTWQFEAGAFVQTQADGYDYSAGYRQAITAPYTLQASFQHRSGSGGGLLFNMPQPNSKNGAYMARYIPESNVIAWGYFDQTGAFQGQGSASVPPPGTDTHVLEINVGQRGYSVSLDGTSLIQGAPVPNAASPVYIGLTSSLSTIAFTHVSVLGTAAEVPTNPVSNTTVDVQGATGTWTTSDGIITQSGTELTDYLAGTGVAAQTFSLSVDMLLPADSTDAGSGLAFDMAGRNDPRGGTMMRLANGGSVIFWGQYDAATGAFAGQGNASLTPTAGAWVTLKLDVHATTFDIYVDGSSIAQGLPRTSMTGWIGLVSFGGPIQFSNLQLTMGEL